MRREVCLDLKKRKKKKIGVSENGCSGYVRAKKKKRVEQSPTLLNMVLGDNRGTRWNVGRWRSTHILVSSPNSVSGYCVLVCCRRNIGTCGWRRITCLWQITVIRMDLVTGRLRGIIGRVIVLTRCSSWIRGRWETIRRWIVILLGVASWCSTCWRWTDRRELLLVRIVIICTLLLRSLAT